MLAMRVDILLVLISWRKHPITVVWHRFCVAINIQSQPLRTCYLFAVVSLGWWLFSPLRGWFFIRCHAVLMQPRAFYAIGLGGTAAGCTSANACRARDSPTTVVSNVIASCRDSLVACWMEAMTRTLPVATCLHRINQTIHSPFRIQSVSGWQPRGKSLAFLITCPEFHC